MKKLLSTMLLLSIVNLSFAGIKSELAMGYKIIKDTVESSVGQGKCLIKGVALRDGEPVQNGLVYSKHVRAVKTNAKGEFRILLDTTDQYLTVSKGENLYGYIEGYKFQGGHEITCEVYLYDVNEIMIVDKPVVYLYSDQELDVEIQLETTMELAFTYPLLDAANKWKVRINSNGIYSASEQSYPYLFWEAKTTSLEYRSQEESIIGEVLNTDTVVNYLETKLEQFGLNAVEKTDFITYWAPRMTQYEYVLTQFNFDQEVEDMAALNVIPEPDHKRRVFMLFSGFEGIPTIDVVTPEWPSNEFFRNGFTLLEWGGTEVSRTNLYKML